MLVDPLVEMKLRKAGLASVHSATYGKVRNWSAQQGDYTENHQGWDLEAPVGTACRAIADGVIEALALNHIKYGTHVLIRFSKYGETLSPSAKDSLFAHYAHLSALFVKKGQLVKAGETIALTGTTGNALASAPHLHFEIRTTPLLSPGLGLVGRVDPATVLGYHHLRSR